MVLKVLLDPRRTKPLSSLAARRIVDTSCEASLALPPENNRDLKDRAAKNLASKNRNAPAIYFAFLLTSTAPWQVISLFSHTFRMWLFGFADGINAAGSPHLFASVGQ